MENQEQEASCSVPTTVLLEEKSDEASLIDDKDKSNEHAEAKDSDIIHAMEQVLALDDSEPLISDELNKGYENIMNVCSTTAQAIKKTIAEVLNSRDTLNSTERKSPSDDLEASLKEKIADFKNVVNDCCLDDKVEELSEDAENDKQGSPDREDKENSPKPTETSEVEIVNDALKLSAPQQRSPCLETNAAKFEDVNQQDVAANLLSNEINDKCPRKQQKNASNKKKIEKTMENVLKSISHCATNQEKLQLLCKKHVEVLEEMRSVEPQLKYSERQVITINREKEQLQAEHNRTILAKSRLESLCRELQRQNKAVKEESLLRIREEEEKRKEVANKFQATLNDISALMQENSKKNSQLREENAELAKKLKALVSHYEMWEKHMEKVVQQKDLEAQLAKAKQAKTNLLLKQETERFLREKQSLLENMNQLQKKCTILATNELQLRTELGDYTAKYEEFQTVLNKSSQVFASFKTDMDTTTKKIKKLEKQTNVYKQKWESSNNALLDMISDKQRRDKELISSQQRVLTLEKLCRALQTERSELRNQVNAISSKVDDESLPSVEAAVQTA